MKETEAPPPFVTHRAGIIAGVLLVSALLLWLLPHWQVSQLNLAPRERILTENALRDTLARILTTAFVLIGAYYTWRYAEAVGKTVTAAERTVAAAERNAMVAQESQVTERFVRAMELLADEKLEVSLGGIYALERIARDSLKDQMPITEVLATYVREHATWHEGEKLPLRPRADVQAIMSVLGRRTWFAREEQPLDLHATALNSIYLPFAHLEKAFLYEANLEGALLTNANLQGAWLWKTHLKGANLEGAHLEGADLTGAVGLTMQQLKSAHLDDKTKLPEYLREAATEREEKPEPEIVLPTKR